MIRSSRRHLLVLLGGPRPRGHTARLAAAFIRGARGWRIERRSLYALCIHPCRDCGACGRESSCPQTDDFQGLAEALTRADALVLAAPMYFYGFPAPVKAMIDRCQPLWHAPLRPKQDRRPAFLLTTCGSCAPRDFDVLLRQGTAFFHTAGFYLATALRISGLERPDGVRRFSQALLRARNLGARSFPGIGSGASKHGSR